MDASFGVYQNLPFGRKNAKRNNICYQVLRRSLHVHGSSVRRDLKIIRSMVQKEGSKFIEVWRNNTKHPVGFDSQHLFFDKFRTCYTTFGSEGKPELLYKLDACDTSKKIESALVFESPVDQHSYLNCTKYQGYKPCLLAVTADGWLVRHDLKTGDVLQKVYLSKNYRFKHLLWESDLQRVVLKSVHVLSQSRPLMFLSIFSMAPLEFQALVPVEKSIFGQDIVDAAASNGFLVIMHHSNRIKFYSMLEVIENYSFVTKLGQSIKSSEGSSIVGSYPDGLPVNVSFSSKPVVLFEISSNQHVISFGGYPWHYISCPQPYSSAFHVCSVRDLKLAKRGILEMNILSVEPDQAYFHADNSGRILHIGSHEIRCLKLCQTEPMTPEFELRHCFVLDLKKEESASEGPKFTSSGREIKARTDQVFNNPGFETILDVDYEDELDVLVVLSANASSDTPCGVIGLYDNQTGLLIQETTVSNWVEDADHSIMMEKDTVVHIIKDYQFCSRKFSCTVYRLNPS